MEMYRKTMLKVIWVGKGALDAILSQIYKKIGVPVSLPVISETPKFSIFQLRHRQGQGHASSRLSSERIKDRTWETAEIEPNGEVVT